MIVQPYDLPIQVLAEIFDYFKAKEQQSLRAVCASWNFVIHSLFEVCYEVNPHRWTALLNTPGRFLHVKISSDCDSDLSKRQSAPFQIFTYDHFHSFCYRLQKLEIQSMDFNLMWLQILQSAQSLRELTLLDVQFPDWTSNSESGKAVRLLGESDEVSTWLPMLQTLRFNLDSSTDLLKIIARSVQNGKLIQLISESGYDHNLNTQDSNKVLQEYIRNGSVTTTNNPAPFDEVVANIMSCHKSTLRTIWSDGRCVRFNSSGSLERCLLWQYFGGRDRDSTPQTAINWMRVLCDQDHLSDLELVIADFRTHALTAEEIAEVKQVEDWISEVISRDRASLTRIDITIQGKFKSDPEWATVKDGIFSKCFSLKHLKFRYCTGDISIGETAENTIANVVFKGIETLPQSLKYFSIDFPISSTANNLQELNLTNLPNLETLVLDCSFNDWFFFNETNVEQFSGADVRLLASKLPKLETLSLNLEETPRSGSGDPPIVHGAQRITQDLRNLRQDDDELLDIILREFLAVNAVQT